MFKINIYAAVPVQLEKTDCRKLALIIKKKPTCSVFLSSHRIGGTRNAEGTLGNRQVFPIQLFRALPNFYECFYLTIRL